MIRFDKIGRLPVPGDNVAIATQKLDAGTVISFDDMQFTLLHTVLEGHRFAIKPIDKDALLTSWGMAFGTATEDIAPGTYVSNVGVLEALRGRRIDFTLPDAPNFTDEIPAFEFDASQFKPAQQVPRADEVRYFEGFDRGPARGVGTRNYIAVIGVSSRTAGFVRRLAHECGGLTAGLENVDGVVPIAHTEGDDAVQLNKTLVLRTLAGFLVHSNIGAALVVDHSTASITYEDLKAFLADEGYPTEGMLLNFMTLKGAYADHLQKGKKCIEDWLAPVNTMKRSRQPLSHLKIALQCGGSDAFSGISGNPLAGWVAKAVIAQGGGANLAETDELIGAESYVLKKVRSENVARRFLYVVDRFQKRAALHGSSAAGNPSGGNKFRGLYNIYLKSLGAAMKRHPDVRLDEVIEYGEQMKKPGYYFMDSPGNDLESIAGQVASGCNVIFFVTGNGSITNFPFVPTIKIVTTSRRYELLSADMDVNAGAYLDGASMDDLGRQMFEQTIEVASGTQSVGELAGHAQVQLWRNWRLKDGAPMEAVAGQRERDEDFSSVPVSITVQAGSPRLEMKGAMGGRGVGLILPTSLCSGQISTMAAEKLNASRLGEKLGIDNFVSLVHTEGCGASSGASEHLFLRTMCGHLSHPEVKHALLLEHGCEKTHNDYFRNYLEAHDVDTTGFGWASIQSDGGIDHVLEKIEHWFAAQAGDPRVNNNKSVHVLSVGLVITESLSAELVDALSELAGRVVHEGGSFLIPAAGGIDNHDSLRQQLGVGPSRQPTLNYAQQIGRPGFHIMAAPTWHVQELLAGMGATGAQILIVASNDFAVPAHPFIPTLQIGDSDAPNLDWSLADKKQAASLVDLVTLVRAGSYEPLSRRQGDHDFQISRGWKGISL